MEKAPLRIARSTFHTHMLDELRDRLDRLSTTAANQPPMSYMIRGNSSDEPDEWDETPFTPTVKLRAKNSDSLHENVQRGATRVYEEVNRRGELAEVRTSWFETERTGYRESSKRVFYLLEVGPTVATAPDVTWNGAFQMDLESAPSHKSDEWKAIASEFQLSERDADRGIPSMVSCAYSELETLTRRNDGSRAAHPQELRNAGPRVADRAFEYAMDLLAAFPGVEAPADDAPAWELVDEPAAEPATPSEAGESHV